MSESESTIPVPVPVLRAAFKALEEDRVDDVRSHFLMHPGLVDEPVPGETWVNEAASRNALKCLQMFLDMGMSINGVNNTPISSAIFRGHIEAVRYLINAGADLNQNRHLISAINCNHKDVSFEIVKLLVEAGIDVNLWWRYGDEKRGPIFNALSWAIDNKRHDIANYLREHGAVMPPEEPPAPPMTGDDRVEEILQWFRDRFGDDKIRRLIDIGPSIPDVDLYCITPGEGWNSTLIFTAGLCRQPMLVPKGDEDFQFAELVIDLPGHWPLAPHELKKAANRWPLDWMRMIIRTVREQRTSLGVPIGVFTNEDPPLPIYPGSRFNSMLLIPEKTTLEPSEFYDGQTFQIYSMIPLLEEERAYDDRRGSSRFLGLIGRRGLSTEFNADRPSLIRPRRWWPW